MRQPADDLGPVGLQAAVEVVQPQAREPARDGVEDARRDPPGERVAALRLPAGDEVEALLELREQARDLGRIVLEVAVDRDDDVALRLLEARLQRGRLAEVAPQPDDADVVVRSVQPGQRARTSRRSSRRRRRRPPRAHRAGRAPRRARRAGARRCAPRRAPGRSPRSRPLAYVSDARLALDRRSARARCSRGSGRSSRARPGRRGGRPRAGGGRGGGGRPAAVRELRDGRVRRPGRGRRRASCRSSSGSRPACRPTGRSTPGEAMEISTGGAVPEGADAVVPIEHVVEHDNSWRSRTGHVGSARPAGRRRRARRRRPARGRDACSAPRRSARSPRPASPRFSCAGGPQSSSSARGPSCARRARRSVQGRSTSRTARCSPRRSRPPARWSSGSGRSPTTRRRTGGRSSGGSRRTCSSARAASRSARTTSSAGSWASSASRRTSGASPSGRGSRSLSRRRGATLVFGLPGQPRLVARRRRAVRAAGAARAPGGAEPGPALRVGAARRRRFAGTRRGTSSSARAPRRDGDETVLEPLTGQESHMIARAAAADALVLVPPARASSRPASASATSAWVDGSASGLPIASALVPRCRREQTERASGARGRSARRRSTGA